MHLPTSSKALALPLITLAVLLAGNPSARAQQDSSADSQDAAAPENPEEDLGQRVEQLTSDTREQVEKYAKQVDESEKAREVSAGILKPIYLLAEKLAFPAFHWVAFAVMVTGVVSYALQLVLAKLIVLSRMSLSLTEIFSDALGLVISLVGLVLTTQAAAENSTFTTSPAAVLSATAVGAVVGFIFYLWGQRQEVEAVKGRRSQKD